MASLNVELSGEAAERLSEEARRRDTTVASLLSENIERIIEALRPEAGALIEEIVAENNELYQRLAR